MTTTSAENRSSLLLDPGFMARLDQLDLVSRKMLAGKMKGERRCKRRGQSVEFADYRNYVVGDDLRFIDWNIYARLDKLFLKLFLEEEDLSLYILLDVSKSCDYGNPNKALYMKQRRGRAGLHRAGELQPREHRRAGGRRRRRDRRPARAAARRADDRLRLEPRTHRPIALRRGVQAVRAGASPQGRVRRAQRFLHQGRFRKRPALRRRRKVRPVRGASASARRRSIRICRAT